MFYYLFYEVLRSEFSPLNVFRYITFRAIYATVTSLFIGLVVGPFVIQRLRYLKFGQHIREDGPSNHLSKAGTPTMGGVLILAAVSVSTLLWTRLDQSVVFALLFALMWFGGLGFLDDYQKISKGRSLGLRGWHKIGLQALGALLLAFYMARWAPIPTDGTPATAVVFPFFKNFRPDLGWLFIPFAVIVIVGASNAVNLTDGLDGLAIGCTIFVATTFALLAHLTSNQNSAEYLGIAHLPAAGEVGVFCAAIVGAGLGLLWYNAHPAEMFMGDTGALGLGGMLGTAALLVKQEILLPVVGGVFVVEAISVILQVWSFRTRGKRIFKMAPLHHHFEELGWAESKIVARFIIVQAILMVVALSTLKLR